MSDIPSLHLRDLTDSWKHPNLPAFFFTIPHKNVKQREFFSPFCCIPTSIHLLLKVYYFLLHVPPEVLELFSFHQNHISNSQRIRADPRLLFQLTRPITAGWILHLFILTPAGRRSLAAEASACVADRISQQYSHEAENAATSLLLEKNQQLLQTFAKHFLLVRFILYLWFKPPGNMAGHIGPVFSLEWSHEQWLYKQTRN